MKRLLTLIFTLIIFQASATEKKEVIIDPANIYPQVKLETSMGTLVVELDRTKAPRSVNNFLTYVVAGEYNNTIFHRVIADFVVQGGGYDVDFIPRNSKDPIINESGNGLKNDFGTIAMARQSDPHSATRQFFFNVANNDKLNPGSRWGYTVFGSLVEGEEVLKAMALVKTDFNEQQSWQDVPIVPIVLIKATLLPAR